MNTIICRVSQPNRAFSCGRPATKLYRLGRTRVKTMRPACDACLKVLERCIAGRDRIITKPIEKTP